MSGGVSTREDEKIRVATKVAISTTEARIVLELLSCDGDDCPLSEVAAQLRNRLKQHCDKVTGVESRKTHRPRYQPSPVVSAFRTRRAELRAELLSLVAVDDVETPALQAARSEALAEALSTLSLRERRVLVLRFGLEDGHSRTLFEVGNEFGVTRERIRQIEMKALRKLRHPSCSRKLNDFRTPP